jgi:hypothetical protein
MVILDSTHDGPTRGRRIACRALRVMNEHVRNLIADVGRRVFRRTCTPLRPCHVAARTARWRGRRRGRRGRRGRCCGWRRRYTTLEVCGAGTIPKKKKTGWVRHLSKTLVGRSIECSIIKQELAVATQHSVDHRKLLFVDRFHFQRLVRYKQDLCNTIFGKIRNRFRLWKLRCIVLQQKRRELSVLLKRMSEHGKNDLYQYTHRGYHSRCRFSFVPY